MGGVEVRQEVLDALRRPVTPVDHDPGRFGLLASATAGRVVEVVPGEPGDPTWTDGATIYVDPDLEDGDQRRAVLVQASLIAVGSLAPEVLRRLHRRGALRRFLAVEGHRALAARAGELPPGTRAMVDEEVGSWSGSPMESVEVATGRTPVPDPPAVFGTIRPRQVRPVPGTGGDDGSTTRHHAARGGDDEIRELEEEDAATADTVIDVLSSPVGGGGALGRLLKRFLGDARSTGGGAPGADSATHRSRGGSGGARTVAISTTIAAVEGDVTSIGSRTTTYPEWDVHRRRYRPDWCTVVEVDVDRLAPLPLPDTHALRRPLARLGVDLERTRRRPQGDDLDIDAVVEARVSARAGATPDESLYVESLRRKRDLAVLLLLDISGSAGEPSPSGRTVHEHQRAATAALMLTLHDLGDRVAVYGFRSQGRSAVHAIAAKRFGEAADTTALHRLGGFTPGGYTRLGAAIRHGTAVLERDAGAPRRLLVVVSDGFAYDHGYEGPYGEADARRALAEARRGGTGCLCLSVGAGTDAAALGRVFGSAAHATVPRPEHLAGIVGPLFQSALRSSEVQRRRHLGRARADERRQIERGTT